MNLYPFPLAVACRVPRRSRWQDKGPDWYVRDSSRKTWAWSSRRRSGPRSSSRAGAPAPGIPSGSSTCASRSRAGRAVAGPDVLRDHRGRSPIHPSARGRSPGAGWGRAEGVEISHRYASQNRRGGLTMPRAVPEAIASAFSQAAHLARQARSVTCCTWTANSPPARQGGQHPLCPQGVRRAPPAPGVHA